MDRATESRKTAGVENIIVHSRQQSAEFSNFCINGRSQHPFRKIKERSKCGMNDSNQRFRINDSLIARECVFKNSNRSNTLERRHPFLNTQRRGLCRWCPPSRRSKPKHETGDGLSFMEHVGFPRKRFAILAAAISQLEQLRSSTVAAYCCYWFGVTIAAACKLQSLINTRRGGQIWSAAVLCSGSKTMAAQSEMQILHFIHFI